MDGRLDLAGLAIVRDEAKVMAGPKPLLSMRIEEYDE